MAKFQKRHYEAIARALKESKPDCGKGLSPLTQWRQDVNALVRLFRDDNSQFDAARFIEACGWQRLT